MLSPGMQEVRVVAVMCKTKKAGSLLAAADINLHRALAANFHLSTPSLGAVRLQRVKVSSRPVGVPCGSVDEWKRQ